MPTPTPHKKAPKKSVTVPVPGFSHVRSAGSIHEYLLKANGLRVLYHHRPGTNVVTTNLTYFVGSRDEARAETGMAHMLEHMLFKPTDADLKAKATVSSAMRFDQETGCILNANTWKDRTTYYFSYPSNLFERAIKIEAERMNGVVLTQASLAPERNSVLSEHDMYQGDPHYALYATMLGAAFYAHPYGHPTIGHRGDIERYTATGLERFYRLYYRPDNAVLMVIGDIDLKTALTVIKKHCAVLKPPPAAIPRFAITEPKQEGVRRVSVVRPSSLNILSLGSKQPGFPSEQALVLNVLFDVLTDGHESVLYRALVDSGLATSVEGSIEPASEENLAILTITLAEGVSHQTVEEKVFDVLRTLDQKTITPLLKKVKAKILTDEQFLRDSSLSIAAELTEYAAAGDWTIYTQTLDILERITAKRLLQALPTLLNSNTQTIGYFIGTAS